MTKVLIGADPEFFVKKDGKFVSAHGLIQGTKKNPLKVKGGAVQVDGMALEFNVNPAEKFVDFEKNMNDVLTELRAMVPLEYEFAFVPVADFDEDYIRNQPEEARALGCEPDFNAYSGKPNNPPDAGANFRTASGHFHLGWTEDEDVNNPEHIEACQMMARQLDCSIGLKSVVFDPDTRRRELYGKAGAYRPKPYGVEYRVLSNFWLNDINIRRDLFSDIKSSFDHLIAGKDYDRNFGNGICAQNINKSHVRNAYDYYTFQFGPNELLDNAYREYLNSQKIAKADKPAPRKKRAVVKPVEDHLQLDWMNRVIEMNQIRAGAPDLKIPERNLHNIHFDEPVDVNIIDDFDVDRGFDNA